MVRENLRFLLSGDLPSTLHLEGRRGYDPESSYGIRWLDTLSSYAVQGAFSTYDEALDTLSHSLGGHPFTPELLIEVGLSSVTRHKGMRFGPNASRLILHVISSEGLIDVAERFKQKDSGIIGSGEAVEISSEDYRRRIDHYAKTQAVTFSHNVPLPVSNPISAGLVALNERLGNAGITKEVTLNNLLEQINSGLAKQSHADEWMLLGLRPTPEHLKERIVNTASLLLSVEANQQNGHVKLARRYKDEDRLYADIAGYLDTITDIDIVRGQKEAPQPAGMLVKMLRKDRTNLTRPELYRITRERLGIAYSENSSTGAINVERHENDATSPRGAILNIWTDFFRLTPSERKTFFNTIAINVQARKNMGISTVRLQKPQPVYATYDSSAKNPFIEAIASQPEKDLGGLVEEVNKRLLGIAEVDTWVFLGFQKLSRDAHIDEVIEAAETYLFDNKDAAFCQQAKCFLDNVQGLDIVAGQSSIYKKDHHLLLNTLRVTHDFDANTVVNYLMEFAHPTEPPTVTLVYASERETVSRGVLQNAFIALYELEGEALEAFWRSAVETSRNKLNSGTETVIRAPLDIFTDQEPRHSPFYTALASNPRLTERGLIKAINEQLGGFATVDSWVLKGYAPLPVDANPDIVINAAERYLFAEKNDSFTNTARSFLNSITGLNVVGGQAHCATKHSGELLRVIRTIKELRLSEVGKNIAEQLGNDISIFPPNVAESIRQLELSNTRENEERFEALLGVYNIPSPHIEAIRAQFELDKETQHLLEDRSNYRIYLENKITKTAQLVVGEETDSVILERATDDIKRCLKQGAELLANNPDQEIPYDITTLRELHLIYRVVQVFRDTLDGNTDIHSPGALLNRLVEEHNITRGELSEKTEIGKKNLDMHFSNNPKRSLGSKIITNYAKGFEYSGVVEEMFCNCMAELRRRHAEDGKSVIDVIKDILTQAKASPDYTLAKLVKDVIAAQPNAKSNSGRMTNEVLYQKMDDMEGIENAVRYDFTFNSIRTITRGSVVPNDIMVRKFLAPALLPSEMGERDYQEAINVIREVAQRDRGRPVDQRTWKIIEDQEFGLTLEEIFDQWEKEKENNPELGFPNLFKQVQECLGIGSDVCARETKAIAESKERLEMGTSATTLFELSRGRAVSREKAEVSGVVFGLKQEHLETLIDEADEWLEKQILRPYQTNIQTSATIPSGRGI